MPELAAWPHDIPEAIKADCRGEEAGEDLHGG